MSVLANPACPHGDLGRPMNMAGDHDHGLYHLIHQRMMGILEIALWEPL
jgi:hypothetical protein